jgi:hypothetical protein
MELEDAFCWTATLPSVGFGMNVGGLIDGGTVPVRRREAVYLPAP